MVAFSSFSLLLANVLRLQMVAEGARPSEGTASLQRSLACSCSSWRSAILMWLWRCTDCNAREVHQEAALIAESVSMGKCTVVGTLHTTYMLGQHMRRHVLGSRHVP